MAGKSNTKSKNSTKNSNKPSNRRGYSANNRHKEQDYNNKKTADASAKSKGTTSNEVNVPRNDMAWYNKYPAILEQVSKIPFNLKTGVGLDLRSVTGIGDKTDFGGTNAIPPFILLHTLPSFGVSLSATSPLNRSAREIFTIIRGHRTGYTSYDFPSVAMYLAAVDSAYTLRSVVMRAYGLYRTYFVENLAFPKAIIEAMGFSFDDLVVNHASWNSLIEYMGLQLSNLPVPSNLSLFARHSYIYSNLYGDANLAKATMIAFTPYALWKYSPTDNKATLVPFSQGNEYMTGVVGYKDNTNKETSVDGLSTKWTAASLKTLFDSLVIDLVTDDDMRKVSSDIWQTFAGSIQAIPMMSPDYKVDPIYDEMMLSQIHNSTYIGVPASSSSLEEINSGDPTKPLWIKSNYHFLNKLAPQEAFFDSLAQCNAIIDFRSASPTMEEIVEGTRLTTAGRMKLLSATASVPTSLEGYVGYYEDIRPGAEIGCYAEMFSLMAEDGTFKEKITFTSFFEAGSQGYQILALAAKVDWMPIISSIFAGTVNCTTFPFVVDVPADAGVSETQFVRNYIQGDLTNIASVSWSTLTELSDAVAYSLFDISQFKQGGRA